MDEKAIRAHEAVAAAQAALHDALGFMVEGCKGEGMDRAKARAYTRNLRMRAHSCKRSLCEICRADEDAFNMLWPEEGTDD